MSARDRYTDSGTQCSLSWRPPIQVLTKVDMTSLPWSSHWASIGSLPRSSSYSLYGLHHASTHVKRAVTWTLRCPRLYRTFADLPRLSSRTVDLISRGQQQNCSNMSCTHIISHWYFRRIEFDVVTPSAEWMCQSTSDAIYQQIISDCELDHCIELLLSLLKQFIELSITNNK